MNYTHNSKVRIAVCLLASLACDIGDINLDLSEPLTVDVTTVGANLDADGYTVNAGDITVNGVDVTGSFAPQGSSIYRVTYTVTEGDFTWPKYDYSVDTGGTTGTKAACMSHTKCVDFRGPPQCMT